MKEAGTDTMQRIGKLVARLEREGDQEAIAIAQRLRTWAHRGAIGWGGKAFNSTHPAYPIFEGLTLRPEKG